MPISTILEVLDSTPVSTGNINYDLVKTSGSGPFNITVGAAGVDFIDAGGQTNLTLNGGIFAAALRVRMH